MTTALSTRAGRKLAPGRWARPGSLAALLACAALAASTAPAGPLDEPHLAIVPHSAAERARVEAVTAPQADFSRAQAFEAAPGGVSTFAAKDGDGALSRAAPPLPAADRLTFELGRELFRRAWVSAPSSTRAADGLGPLFNARACQSCHRAGGRGQPPEAGRDAPSSLVLRISVPGSRDDAIAGIAEYVANRPDPTYGTQLQDRALPGLPPEYRLEVSYRDRTVALSGGEIARLRSPAYRVHDLGYGPLAPGAMLSPRLAPSIFGLGLLEAIPAADILAGADPEDADGDGISGRANIVRSAEFAQPMLGRFGLKAGIATLREQTAAAFAADIGLSTPLFPDGFGDCSTAQRACRMASDGGDAAHQGVEIGAAALDLVAAFVRQSGVPARRDADAPQVLRGKRVFHLAGCAACHRPSFVTHRLQDAPAQSFQLIWPYTDMLLHDMGDGLADHRPEARATGREWRTAPLWGLGLTARASGRAGYLHDGRARSLLEAILWHGGEAGPARDRVAGMPPEDRAALIRFLESL